MRNALFKAVTKSIIAGAIFVLHFLLPAVQAQNFQIDSLKELKATLKADTNKCMVLNRLAWQYFLVGEYKEALSNASECNDLSKQIKFQKAEAESNNIMGVVYCSMGSYPKALGYFIESLALNEKRGDKRSIGRNLMNIGIVHMYQKENDRSLTYLFRALEINQQRKDETGIASCLLNIALVYRNQKNFKKSLEYYQKSYDLSSKLENEGTMANALLNMGIVYNDLADIERDAGKNFQANSENAREYYLRALQMQEDLGDQSGIAHTMTSIAGILIWNKQFAQAEPYLKKALELSGTLGSLELQKFGHETYYHFYKEQGDHKHALEHYAIKSDLQDSMFNLDNQRALLQKEMQFEYEKKEAEIQAASKAEKDKITALASAEKKKQQIIIFSVCFFLLLVIIVALTVYNRFKVTQKQKQIIEVQKHQVEEKNKEIQDSITYAKRLQNAILPPREFINTHLPENFVFYQPKDIVAGDFYWMEVITQNKAPGRNDAAASADLILIAVADSTGHGVPGAMVSVVCSNALNRAVLEFEEREPGKILDKTTEIVLETFIKSGEDIKDGMDISLLVINKKEKKISWSGANNNLWYVYSGATVMMETVADKQPVGRSDNRHPFKTHEIPFTPGTMFYLITDGYADQFGGAKGKKFKYKQLERLLLENSSRPPDEQKKILAENFQTWKGDLEQVDDVCILGVRM